MRVVLSTSMLITLVWIIWLPQFRAQSTPPPPWSGPSRALDALLQDYAYRAFVRPRTGVPYEGVVPENLTGIQISALRLRSGSLRTRGVSYKDFEIPMGVVVTPYVERLVLVYHNLANWSSQYYSLSGYTQLAPVVGLLAYDAFNLSAKNLPELEIQAPSDKLISIKFPQVQSVPDGATAQCVWFGLDGLAQLSNVLPDNVCETAQQGHFSIVAKSIAPAPSPTSLPPSPRSGEAPPSKPTGGGGDNDKDDNSKKWVIAGSVVGGFVLLVLLGLLIFCVRRYKRRNKMQQMEKAAEVGEALHMTSVGNSRAPVAMGTRTQPTLENEYVP